MSQGPRRGSSLFSNPGAASSGGGGTPPAQGASGGGGPRQHRGSVVLPGMGPGGIGFGIDFDDSDYEDSDDEDIPHGGPHKGKGGLPGQPMPIKAGGGSTATGGPNHRPLVGGFAAAAYEAARAHHYQNAEIKPTMKGGKSGQPPPAQNRQQPKKPY